MYTPDLMTNSLSIERPLRRLEPVSAAAAVKRDRRAETEAVRAAINRHIGRRVRSIRIARGRTQAELGEALGLTNQQVQKYEKGANGLSFERLWLMARYFDIDVHYFLDDMWDAAAIAFEDRSTAPAGAEPPQYPRLRLKSAPGCPTRRPSRKAMGAAAPPTDPYRSPAENLSRS